MRWEHIPHWWSGRSGADSQPGWWKFELNVLAEKLKAWHMTHLW